MQVCGYSFANIAMTTATALQHNDPAPAAGILLLTHEEIGQLIGSSRETITRALAEFKSRRWISIKGSTMLVKNVDALKDVVGDDVPSSWAVGTAQVLPGSGLPPVTNFHGPALAGENFRQPRTA